jgi:hypothetical protein
MKFMRNLGYLSAILSITALANPAIANQIPTSGAAWTGTGTTAAATKDTPSGLRTTVSVSGSGMTMGSRTNASLQTANTITVPTLPSATNGMQVLATANASCNNAALICNNLGTITINFTDTAGNPILVKNPVLHMSRLGGALSYTSGGITANYYLGGVLTLTTPGAVLNSATGGRGFQVTGGNKIALDYTTFPATAAAGSSIGDCTASPNAPQAGCGSIPVTGLVSSLSFNVDMNRNNTSGNWQSLVGGNWAADGIYFTVSFDEDFGDAPASYDPTTAASHIVSDLALGSAIDVDNPTISNGAATGATSITPSPNAVAALASNSGANGDGADEDAITSFPSLASNSTSYALTVPISGASRAGQVCGWIDLNRNNIFDNPTERTCGSFAIGATSVNLNWTGLSGLTAGNNYVRLRASYDGTGVQNPTGRLSSGEVEDYQIAITASVPLNNPPTTTDLNAASQPNPGGTTAVQVTTLAGSDLEDGPLGAGKSFKIVSLPTNGTLSYNNAPVLAGQIITNYDPTLLKLDPNDGAITVSFTYAAIDSAGKEDPTPATVTMPFTVAATLNPNLLLVKRITEINGGKTAIAGDNLALYKNDPSNPYDDNTLDNATPPDTDKWPDPAAFLLGGINGGKTSPNDSLEYSIYFLSSGDVMAKNVLFCDRVPDDVSFLFNGYGGSSPLGLTGDEKGIELFHNGTTTALSNVPDGDLGQYFPPGVDPKGTYPNVNCQGANTNGAVVVKLGDLPNASAPGTPDASYGYVRFKVHVK